MTVQTQQDSQYIDKVRTQASRVLDISDLAPDLQAAWGVCFGLPERLNPESFAGTNEGLTKAQLSAGLSVLQALVAWLDEPGQNRRGYLQQLRIIS